MKKIYIFTAVLALLTLSLNAQLKARKNGTAVPPKSSTEQVDKEVTKPDGYFRMGPSRASSDPVTPPYSNKFDSQDEWNWWETIDVVGDGDSDGYGMWTLYSNRARYRYDSANDADDWLITAPVTLKAGKTYKMSFVATTSSGYDERLEVKLASSNTATALSNGTEIIPSTAFRASSGRTFSNENITVSADGNYYFGIHAISDADMNYLYIDNFVIDVIITDPTIQVSTNTVNISSIPGVTATQMVDITGLYLTGDITATISGQDAGAFSVNPASLGTSGGELTISYTPTAVGTHTATLTLSSTDADDVTVTLNGTATNDLTICEGNTEIANLPVYGNYNEQYQINQMIYPADKLSGLVGKDLTSMTFYATANLSSSLAGSVWSVKLGTTDQTSFASSLSNITRLEPSDIKTVITGYALPVGENLMTIVFSSPFTYNGGNLLVDFESTTKGSTYTPTNFYGVNQGSDIGYYSYASSNTSTSNGHYEGGYTTTNLPKVTFTFEDSEPRHDLSIALSAPASIVGGNTATVTATVTNTGNQTETSYTVTITDGTNNLLNQTATEPLAPGATATFTAEYNTTEAQVGNTVNFTANVTCADDADASNNSATASMQIITMPAPENVAATTSGNNATMTWTAPSTLPMLPGTMTWDFEEETDFNAFTTIDADGDGYNWTWHYNGVTDDGNLTGHDESNGVVYSESYHNTGSNSGVALTPSNWLISPEVTLGGTLTLWACGQDEGYPAEKLGVYVCVGSYNDSTSFVRVDADVTTTSEMTQYSFNLSQYEGQQGYFAIVHHNVTDQFILNIDDISYETLVPTAPVSYNIYLDGELVGHVAADAALTYNFSNLASGGHTASVSAVYPGGIESAAVPAEFTILPTPNAPTVSSNDGTTSTTITITPDANTDGQLVYYVDYNGSQTQDLTFSRGANDYTVEVHAYTTATSNYNQSPEAVVPVTIPALPKTDMPVITSEQVGDYLVITATGNGIVTLNIPGYPEAQGNGSASISVPCGVVSSTVTATATAQEDGKQKSDPREQTITIPAGEGWIEMTGTYDDDDDLLSLEVKVGNDTIDIMMVDQFVASTYSNEHSDGYTYTMQETVNDVDWFSNPAPIPVFKTSSTLQGLYTQTQVDNDTLMQYRANVLNTEIDYTVKPDPLVMYYDLYRGGKNEVYPVVDPGTEISRLQQFSDEANAQYFYYETHQSGIAPRYDHVGEQLVERIDTGYVDGIAGDEIAYVPVIWVPGLSTARGDGKNNSYGSDIKYNELGGVNISVEGFKNDENNTTGQWVYQDGSQNGITYCVYSPIITLNGIMPEIEEAHDGETYQYVPYMYRVWCTYPSAHNFTFLDNPDGRKHLVDAGPIEAPFLIGEATAEDSVWHNNGEEVVFGRALASGEGQQPWSFGVPKTEDSQNVKFIARFYYKKIVTPAAQANGLRGNRDGEEAFAIAENSDNGSGIITGIDELWNNVVYVVSKTYVNAQGMQSDKPFDGLNIVVTRFSDGTTTTTKVVR